MSRKETNNRILGIIKNNLNLGKTSVDFLERYFFMHNYFFFFEISILTKMFIPLISLYNF